MEIFAHMIQFRVLVTSFLSFTPPIIIRRLSISLASQTTFSSFILGREEKVVQLARLTAANEPDGICSMASQSFIELVNFKSSYRCLVI